MKQRLVLLNLLLLALVSLAAWQLRERWLAARAEENRILSEQAKPARLAPVTPPQPTPPVTAANYMEVVSHTLFSPDRNPDEIPAPPPPKPVMPALPFTQGMMTIEGRTIVIMSLKSGEKPHGYSPGDKVGEFQFVSVQGNVLTFDWNGEKVSRRMEEMKEKAPEASAQYTPPLPSAPVVSAVEVVKTAVGPGPRDEASGYKNCVANDNSAPGTVQDGYKKVVQSTPFGSACRWEPVK